jgi:molybdate transport system substrate-binding protein
MTTVAFLEDIMRLSFRTIAVSTLTLIVSSTLAPAAEVRVLSVGSTQIAAKAIAGEFEKQTGHKVIFTIRPNIDKELAEKTFDAVILSVPAMDSYDEAGDLVPMSRVALARVGVGVVVKEGGPVPDVSTPEKLKATVLAARSLTHTDPAIPNTSGAVAGAALAKLGILDEVKDKTRYAALAVGGGLVAKGEVELGFFHLSEIPKGVTMAGALPGPLQGYTVYEAAALSNRSTAEAVSAFVKYLASAAAAAHWSGAKLEPAETYMRTLASQ